MFLYIFKLNILLLHADRKNCVKPMYSSVHLEYICISFFATILFGRQQQRVAFCSEAVLFTSVHVVTRRDSPWGGSL